jgi:hypothetical protein
MLNIGEGTLAIPTYWQNASINVYTAQPAGAKGLSITVNRDRLPLGGALQDYVSAQTSKLAGQLKDYRQVHAQAVTIDGRVGHLLELTWNSPDAGEIHQLLLTVADGQTVLNFAGTSPGKMTSSQRDELGRILLSFRFVPAR